MLLFTAFALITGLGLMAWIRLAPVNPQVWNVMPAPALGAADSPWNTVTALTGGAVLRLSPDTGDPALLLARLDRIALATRNTRRLAGDVAQGRITWVTRSDLWGFPDYTTAQVQPDGLYLYARLRFGREDFGVNAARLNAWLAQL